MFRHKTRIYLHHTDAAGRLFFANQFYLTYEAKEHFLESLGLSIEGLLNHPRLTFPLVHAEADYKALLVAGDEIEIEVAVEKIGETSVVFAYTLFKKNAVVGTARTVSVAVDKKTQKKVPIPPEWCVKFEQGLKPQI